MVEALKACPADVLVMGNLDPVGIFKMALAGGSCPSDRGASESHIFISEFCNFKWL